MVFLIKTFIIIIIIIIIVIIIIIIIIVIITQFTSCFFEYAVLSKKYILFVTRYMFPNCFLQTTCEHFASHQR